MKKIFAIVLLMNMVFFAAAQTTIVNDANAEKRNVPAFTGISVSSNIDLYISQGNEDAIAVSAAEKKYRDGIQTEVKNGILKIWYNNVGNHFGFGNKKLRAYVSFKSINALEASGSSDVYISGLLKAGGLHLSLSGSSDLKGAVDIENLTANISGASDITITGKVESLNIDASGASDFKDYNLVAQTCEATASGSSDINITVEKELNAHASGSSDILIKGNGVIKKMNKSGSASIKKV